MDGTDLPQLLWIALMALALGVALAKNGQPETGTHRLHVTVLAVAIQAGLLYWGGFFNQLLGL